MKEKNIMEKYRIVMLHEMTAQYIKNDNENDSSNQNIYILKSKVSHCDIYDNANVNSPMLFHLYDSVVYVSKVGMKKCK
jgi:hypothetical protein